MINRSISLLIAVTVAAVGLAACGSGSSDQVVARVAGGASISKSSLEHWMRVEAVLLYQEKPTAPVPKGVIPDPPGYASCISYLRSTAPKATESGATLTSALLKSRCTQKTAELKVLTLNTLLDWYWTISAGMALGLSASPAEVEAKLQEFTSSLFPSKAAFATYLKRTEQTVSDLMLRSKMLVFQTKLFQKLLAEEKRLPKTLSAQQRQSALAALATILPPGKSWAAKTTCLNGYVVSACKEYQGPLSPGIPN